MATGNRNRLGFLRRAFDVYCAATVVTEAIRTNRRPNDRDLETLGIDPATFRNTRNF